MANFVVGLQNLIVTVPVSTASLKFLVRLEIVSNLKACDYYIDNLVKKWPARMGELLIGYIVSYIE